MPVPKPAYVPSSPPLQSSSSSGVQNPQPTQTTTTHCSITCVSASEIWIFLTLYWIIIPGLKKRYRAAEDVLAKSQHEKLNGKMKAKERFPPSKRMMMPRLDPARNFRSLMILKRKRRVLRRSEMTTSTMLTRKRKSTPTPPTPIRIPPNSPVRSPPSSKVYIRPLSNTKSIHHKPTTQSQIQKSGAELDVQDAAAEPDVVFDEAEEEDEEDETMAAEIDRGLAEMHAASVSVASAVSENMNQREGTLVIVEISATLMEEGMHALPAPPHPIPTPLWRNVRSDRNLRPW